MSSIINLWRAIKRRLDEFNFGPPIEDDDESLSDSDRLNFELAEIAFRQQAFSPPSVADSEE